MALGCQDVATVDSEITEKRLCGKANNSMKTRFVKRVSTDRARPLMLRDTVLEMRETNRSALALARKGQRKVRLRDGVRNEWRRIDV